MSSQMHRLGKFTWCLACATVLAMVLSCASKEESPSAPPATPTVIEYQGPASEAVADLRACLEDQYPAGLIVIEKADLGGRTGQEFYLAREGDRTVIRYTTVNSLNNAVYTLLDHLGFRWYGPGANWFVKPAQLNPAPLAGRWDAPAFRNRGFFGTGGLDFGRMPAFDSTNEYKKNWHTWKRRNRFSADFPGVGHCGGAFYLSNKALLDAHPEWFNCASGKRHGRIKIEVPEAVAAFKAWATKWHAAAADGFVNIGVDPEDGRGGMDDPLPPDGFAGINGWNHADKWWWLANEVAKEYPEEDRHVVVSMYAYGDGATNALAPKFRLRRNVYPTIIPYAFQRAYLPQEMVKVWAGAIDGTMGLYDYWNITQWSLGLPQFHLHGMKDKLRFWHENKVDGVYIESTEAAGPMGHAWWIAGQLQFDMSKDFETLYAQYLADCFGAAAPAMKRMYDRWSLNPQGAGEVSLTLADLRDADALVARGSPAWKRINELKAYAHYMKLYYEHDGTQESKDRLFEYLYSIHHLCMVQTAAFMGQHYIAPLTKGNIVPAGTDRRLSEEEIDAQFRADLESSPRRYEVLPFRFDFSRAKYTEPASPSSWRFGRNPTVYFVPKTAGTVSFDAGCEIGDSRLSVFTDDAILLNEKVGVGHFDYAETLDGRTWRLKRFTLPVEAGKRYTVRLQGGFNRFKMNSDVIVYNAHGGDDFDNYAYPPHYLYVPRMCREIIFEDMIALRADGTVATGLFFAPGEKRGKENAGAPVGIKNLYRVEVKPEWRGKVIVCQFSHTSWSLKNLPGVVALQPFEYDEPLPEEPGGRRE